MKQQGPIPASELISSCQGLVRSIAWKIHCRVPRSVELDDLIGYGQVGLTEAARDFDQSRGIQFTTYAYYRVRGAILDGLSTMAWFTKADYHRGRYERMTDDVLGSVASDDDVGWFAQSSRALSMTYIMTHWGSDEYGAEPSDDRTPMPDDAAEAEDLRTVIHDLVDQLPSQEQQLIRGIYFEGLTIKEAGERIGISKAWASRLHARTLDSLAIRMSGDDD
ncbi:MAG: sigma-70 family RNA polymerase sigma factor [Fuerstiella sp.]